MQEHPDLENEVLVASAERFVAAAQEVRRFRELWTGVVGFEAVGIMLDALYEVLAGGVTSITSSARGEANVAL